ncbi:hypothetical protein N7523_002693 [Penicillium sp. IBT 18751x]|nr:hypothetical protein N7523_002693 [Penicillium sp. IBT 18751x]
MSRDSSSQDPPFIRRDPADQSESSASLPEANYLSSLLESGQAPGYQQGAFPTPVPAWVLDNPRPTLESASHQAIPLQIPLHSQTSATSLNSSSRLAGSILDSAQSHTETVQSIPNRVNCGECLTQNEEQPLENALYPGPMSVAAGGYLTGPMQPHSHRKSLPRRGSGIG